MPQGPVLGPLFFSLYVTDLAGYLLNCKIHLYADDVQLSLKIDDISRSVDYLNGELARIFLWANANGLFEPWEIEVNFTAYKKCFTHNS